MNFKVINGVKRERPNYFDLYFNAFSKCVERLNNSDSLFDELKILEKKRFVYYGVKMLNAKNTDGLNYDELLSIMEAFEFIKGAMSQLSPNEFENIFPIEKKYDGEKNGWKDYFFTKNAIAEIGENTPILEKINDFLWDYQNWDVSHFMVNNMSLISDIRRVQGQKGLMEEFMDENDVPYYTMHTDEKGKQYLENSQTGEVTKVRKAIPRYLHVVK
ncbi:hypothetical protein H70357_24835 [Paenibacillus sp. FSL H7-0357]|uniref:hypothetical protein n=1 Tax=Paenibacillus sp. FSL H7-0357 TaxID=1536774 RepID=UPI0004F865EB|nr:hypothetical protein [Paenibacillus sp. FSL H7-0357]AIQ19573.1 hypothetical protein H70357_24835 [Paenibacillus sp. FSL H7-0357]